jgi:hypothetical protein
MRVLPVVLRVCCLGGPASAGDSQGDNPMFALVRHCVIAAEEARGTEKICIYDCLISRDLLAIDAAQSCPITVKQLLFGNGKRKLVAR